MCFTPIMNYTMKTSLKESFYYWMLTLPYFDVTGYTQDLSWSTTTTNRYLYASLTSNWDVKRSKQQESHDISIWVLIRLDRCTSENACIGLDVQAQVSSKSLSLSCQISSKMQTNDQLRPLYRSIGIITREFRWKKKLLPAWPLLFMT